MNAVRKAAVLAAAGAIVDDFIFYFGPDPIEALISLLAVAINEDESERIPFQTFSYR